MRTIYFLSVIILGFFIAGCGSETKPVTNAPVTETPASTGLVNDQNPGEEYIVWVDKLNLRAAPNSGSESLQTLGKGDTLLIDRSEQSVDANGYTWFKFLDMKSRKSGWVADKFILPQQIYDQFRKADELGKAGKNTEMMTEIKRIDGEIYKETTIVISPDGRKVVIQVLLPNDIIGPILYFCANIGLKDILGYHQWLNKNERWTADSRFIFDLVPISSMNTLFCYDTKTQQITYFDSVSGKEYNLVDDLTLLWLKMENSTDIGEFHNVFLPALMMSNLETGKSSRILKADVSTLRKNQNTTISVPEVKMVPDETAPTIVTASSFYIKYANQYVETGESDG